MVVALRDERPVSEVLIDQSHWPVLVVTPPPSVTDEALQQNFDDFQGILRERPGPYACVVDLRVSRGLTPKQRRMITDSITDVEAVQDRSPCMGFAMVFSSRALQRILTAIFWVRRPSYPIKVFVRIDDAFEWARERVPKQRPMPVANAALPDQTAGPWAVVAGTFAEASQAEQCSSLMRRQGLEPRVRAAEGGHEVSAQGYASRTDAMMARERLRGIGIDATLTRKK